MTLTVSALADQAGLSADTVRYYERVGLLPKPARSAAGYRLYDQDAVGRLRLIKGAQRAGLRLVALLVLLAACTREPAAPQQPPLTLPSGPSTSAAPAAGDGDWTTYHRDNARSGYLAGLADPSRLTQAWSARLDGAVYGQPLVVGDRVLVATEADSLYALSLRSGQV
jgi:DNA-binding transcriptional MerR regulator